LRINQYIALNLPTSRRKADELIKNGEVLVNNEIATLGTVIVDSDIVFVYGKKINNTKKHEYYRFYKPKGYICSHNKQGSAPTIFELIGKNYLKFGGRLDKDSEGLMLLSTDGQWLDDIFRAKNKIEKKYIVTITTKIDTNKKLRINIKHNGEYLRINKLKVIDNYSYQALLTSGKNHEIRRIFRFNKLKIKTLKRVSIGDYSLDKLDKGELSKIEKF